MTQNIIYDSLVDSKGKVDYMLTAVVLSLGIGYASPIPAPAPIHAPQQEFGKLGFVGIAPAPVAEPVQITTVEDAPVGNIVPAVESEPVTVNEPVADSAPVAMPIEPKPVAVAPASGVVGIGQQYVGVPYVLGGTTPSGFDCSGFTSYVFAQAGINLPRTAAAQQAMATPVNNPQPGDLVFWGSPAWHVGIYAGNGMVIDAGNPGTGVIYRSVFSGVSGYGRV